MDALKFINEILTDLPRKVAKYKEVLEIKIDGAETTRDNGSDGGSGTSGSGEPAAGAI